MPLTGAIPEGPSFFCPHCGALYAVTYSRLIEYFAEQIELLVGVGERRFGA